MTVRLTRFYLPLLLLSATAAACGVGPLRDELKQTKQTLDQAQQELRELRGLKEQRLKQRLELEQENKRLRQQLKRYKMVQEVAQSVSRIRGLPLIQPLKIRHITESGFIKRFLREEFYREYTPQYIEAYTASLIKIGLFPEGMQLFKTMQELLMEQWAGFYHPPKKTFFIRPGVPLLETIMAHEITHALQDQSYDLQTLIRSRKGNDDGTFALQALVEGDALLTMITFTAQNMTFRKVFSTFTDVLGMMAMDQRKLMAAPPYLREHLLRMYTDGMAFVQALQREHGARAVDQAFGDPPRTSEQILHPEKYLRRELPRLTTLPALRGLPADWKLIHENTLGEVGVSILLEAQGKWRAQAAAEGWDGDRLHAYRHRDKGILIAWLTRWDSAGDAQEFTETLMQYLDSRYKRGPGGWRSPDGIAAIQRSRAEVLLLDGAITCEQRRSIAAQLKMSTRPCPKPS